MGFQTVNGLTTSQTDAQGLITWGTAPYDVIQSTPFNATFRDLQEAGHYQLLPGVIEGGVCTAAGLTVSVPANTVAFARQVWIASGTTSVNVADNQTSYVWLCADGEVRATSALATFPTSFDGRSACLLCQATAVSGVVTIDLSVQQKARTAYGDARRVCEGNAGSFPLMDVVPSGVTMWLPPESQTMLFDRLQVSGTVNVGGRLRVYA